MMAQKKHKNKAAIVHHLPKNVIDLELLWRCLSNFGMNRKNKNRIIKNLNTLYIRSCYWRARRRPIDIAVKGWFDASYLLLYIQKASHAVIRIRCDLILISIVVVVVRVDSQAKQQSHNIELNEKQISTSIAISSSQPSKQEDVDFYTE